MGKLESPHLVLKELHQDLFDQYMLAFSPLICRLVGSSSVEAERIYLEMQLQKVQIEATFFFCIFEKISEMLIGAIEIRNQSYRGQLYNWINEEYWGNGYYKEAMLLTIPAYFKRFPEEDHFNARVDVSNLRSYYALKKIGFKETGIYKGAREDQFNLIFIDS